MFTGKNLWKFKFEITALEWDILTLHIIRILLIQLWINEQLSIAHYWININQNGKSNQIIFFKFSQSLHNLCTALQEIIKTVAFISNLYDYPFRNVFYINLHSLLSVLRISTEPKYSSEAIIVARIHGSYIVYIACGSGKCKIMNFDSFSAS